MTDHAINLPAILAGHMKWLRDEQGQAPPPMSPMRPQAQVYREIALDFGINRRTVRDIAKSITWKEQSCR